jgi:hypothetical protein
MDAADEAGRMPSGGRLRPLPLAARCGLSAAGRPSIPHSGEGEAGGAANAASRGAARGRGASRCRMRRRAPFPLMSPPQRPASRASRYSEQWEGRMPDLRFVVFAARRKPPPTSWSRAARAGGHRLVNYLWMVPGRVWQPRRYVFCPDKAAAAMRRLRQRQTRCPLPPHPDHCHLR